MRGHTGSEWAFDNFRKQMGLLTTSGKQMLLTNLAIAKFGLSTKIKVTRCPSSLGNVLLFHKSPCISDAK